MMGNASGLNHQPVGPGPAGQTAELAAQFILGSASPQRRDILAREGFRFRVVPSNVDEDAYRHLSPWLMAQHLAEVKARFVAAQFPSEIVLAADTVVALGEMPLGKPVDRADATRMLAILSGTTHRVITGVAVVRHRPLLCLTAHAVSTVRMRMLNAAEIEAYILSGLWEGKAGGYGIQDNDGFVTCITGSRTNIIGLPVGAARELLRAAGVVPVDRGLADKRTANSPDE